MVLFCFFNSKKSAKNPTFQRIFIFCLKFIWQIIFFSYTNNCLSKKTKPMPRIVFHIDVNSAFLSWSAKQVLEQGYKVDIRDIVCVVGVEEIRKGFCIACSIPAKKLWIKAPMRISDARKIYPGLKVAPPDYEYYKKCSDEMMDILKKKFELFQQYSIDECFVEYTEEMQENDWDPVKVANEIREYIKKKCWFTVNIGIWNNKFLAKMASDFEKPDKVHTLFIDEIETKLWPLPIKDLFGCWRETEPKLKKLWIQTIWDLAKLDKAVLKARLWNQGAMLSDFSHGIDNSKVENNYNDRKCIWASSITKVDTKDSNFIYSFYEGFAAELAIALKDRNLAWDRVTVHVRYTDFSYKSHQRKLNNPINTPEELYNYAIELFNELWNKQEVNLVGLTISWLQDAKFKQNGLF